MTRTLQAEPPVTGEAPDAERLRLCAERVQVKAKAERDAGPAAKAFEARDERVRQLETQLAEARVARGTAWNLLATIGLERDNGLARNELRLGQLAPAPLRDGIRRVEDLLAEQRKQTATVRWSEPTAFSSQRVIVASTAGSIRRRVAALMSARREIEALIFEPADEAELGARVRTIIENLPEVQYEPGVEA